MSPAATTHSHTAADTGTHHERLSETEAPCHSTKPYTTHLCEGSDPLGPGMLVTRIFDLSFEVQLRSSLGTASPGWTWERKRRNRTICHTAKAFFVHMPFV
jgi:hypothetical protein